MKTKISLSSDEASEVLIALYFRSCQKDMNRNHSKEIVDLGKSLASQWEEQFKDWEPGVWKRVCAHKVRIEVQFP